MINIDNNQFKIAVQRFIKSLPYQVDIDREYRLIQQKKSKLSRNQRDTIVAIVEYKKELEQKDKEK